MYRSDFKCRRGGGGGGGGGVYIYKSMVVVDVVRSDDDCNTMNVPQYVYHHVFVPVAKEVMAECAKSVLNGCLKVICVTACMACNV